MSMDHQKSISKEGKDRLRELLKEDVASGKTDVNYSRFKNEPRQPDLTKDDEDR